MQMYIIQMNLLIVVVCDEGSFKLYNLGNELWVFVEWQSREPRLNYVVESSFVALL